MKRACLMIAILFGAGCTVSFAFAEENVQPAPGPSLAQSKSVQKGVQEVETGVLGLVTARDENVSDDLGLRIDAFKKVIDLSLSEAKDLQVRALLVEKDSKDIALWRETALTTIEDAIRHIELLKKRGVAHIKDLQTVKAEAEELRAWREEYYTPVLQAVNDYTSLKKGREIIAIARERSQKISKDLQKVRKSGNQTAGLQNHLLKANLRIADGEKGLKTAEELFQILYLLPLTSSSSEALQGVSVSSTLQAMILSSQATSSPSLSSQGASSPSTSSLADTSTSTSSLLRTQQDVLEGGEIRDLIRSSFEEIKQAYQIFIEMSGLVRKSL